MTAKWPIHSTIIACAFDLLPFSDNFLPVWTHYAMTKIVLLTEQAYIHKFFLNKEHLKLSIYYLEKTHTEINILIICFLIPSQPYRQLICLFPCDRYFRLILGLHNMLSKRSTHDSYPQISCSCYTGTKSH